MTQAALGNLESPLSGSAFINTYLEPAMNAILSSHSGSSRPSYAGPALVWMDTTTNPWVWKAFDGAQDIIIGYFDTDTNLFTPANATDAANISYDNGGSTLTSDNVQDAIDEIVETFPVSLRLIPQVVKTVNYTTIATDAGKHILHPSADVTARSFNIAANSSVPYEVGSAITFVNQNGAGSLTIGIDTDTMRLAGSGATGNRTLAPNGMATALKIGATEWIISGTGLT